MIVRSTHRIRSNARAPISGGLVAALLFGVLAPLPPASASARVIQESSDASPAALPAAVDEALDQALDVALARGFDDRAHEELYRLAMIEWADVAPIVEELERRGERGDRALENATRWLVGHLEWNFGELDDARRTLQSLSRRVDDARVLWSLACIHDALDDRESAKETYERALATDPGAELEGRIRLRLAMLPVGQVEEQDDEAAAELVAFGTEAARDDDERNRAAVVLALDGRFDDAIELFTVGDPAAQKPSVTFQRELRLTEWAISAGDAAVAKEHGWRAVDVAGPRRDRRYGLGLLVEAHRLDDTLDDLIAKLEQKPDRTDEDTQVWISLLRETGRYERAMEWFRASEEATSDEEDLADEVRSQLLDLCREWGREDLLETEYRRLIAEHPASIIWREGLSRFLLEKGRSDDARRVWADYLTDESLRRYLLTAAESMAGLGLDDLALQACEVCIAADREAAAAHLFAADVHRLRGRHEQSLEQLERLDARAAPDAPARMALAEAFEQRGALDEAVHVLEGVRAARGEAGRAEDLDMRLAWLLSEVDREEDALALWRELWERVESPGRRRYVEQRLMTVASRLGVLADIAIELETALAAGEASDRDAGLLVQLYSRVNDPVSATEVLETFLAQSGAAKREELTRKSRIYLECKDYYRYERTLRELMEVDPEGSPDYLRQLAMSALERGQAREAREILDELVRTERSNDSAEFEAGVLALAGLREEAVAAYRRSIASNPDRIENYLLLANVMRDLGARRQAIGMFQYLAENAAEDDLFTIAIDGLLNMEAGERALRWARRCALERIASRHDKTYLYQLVADLSEQLNDQPFIVRSLEGALPIAAERRVSLLRELLDLTPDNERKLRFGRRLVGSGQLVPPDVYISLGETFVAADDVASATRTFAIADRLQEASSFQVDVARVFEKALYLTRARDAYARALIGRDTDIGLLAKLGEIHEQVGDDGSALVYYRRAIDTLIGRQPLVATKGVTVGGDDSSFGYFGTRNVDEYDEYLERCITGLLTAASGRDQLVEYVDELVALTRDELERSLEEGPVADRRLAQFPRVARRSDLLRRIALAVGAPERIEDLDTALCATFAADTDLLGRLVSLRIERGYAGAARALWRRDEIPSELRGALAHRFDDAVAAEGARSLGVDIDPRTAVRRLPRLVARGDEAAIRRVLLGLLADPDGASEVPTDVLVATAREVDDPELHFRSLRLAIDRALGVNDSASVRSTLATAARLLDADYRALLEDHVTREVLSDDARAAAMLDLLLDLEERSGRELVDDDLLVDLVGRALDGRGYWAVQPFFGVLPEELFTGVLRSTITKVPESNRADFVLDIVNGMQRPLGESSAELVRGTFRENVAKVDNPAWLHWTLQQLGTQEHDPELAMELLDIFVERWGDAAMLTSARTQCLVRMGRPAAALEKLFELYADDGLLQSDDWELRRAIEACEAVLVETHLESMVERLVEIGASQGQADAARRRCIGLFRRVDGENGELRYHRWAAERWRDDGDVLAQFADALRREPALRWERLALLERVVELTQQASEEREDACREVERFWRDLDNPIEKERWDERGKAVRKARRAREKAEREAAGPDDEVADAKEQEANDAEDAADEARKAPVSSSAVAPTPALRTAASSSSATSTATGTIALGGLSVSLGGEAVAIGVVDDADENSEKARPANLQAVASEFTDEDSAAEQARVLYRRVWRTYPQDDRNNVFYFGGGSAGFGERNGVPAFWPGELPEQAARVLDPESLEEDEGGEGEAGADADEAGAAAEDESDAENGDVSDDDRTAAGSFPEPPPRQERGGLDDLRDPPEPVVDELFPTYEVLVETDVGREEMWRQLRTRTPAQLDHCGRLFAALAARERRVDGAVAAIDRLLVRFDAGTAGRIELELLLQHLLAGHGTERDDVRGVLVQLLDAAPPSDPQRLADIARLLALGGRASWSRRLLPWCASLSGSSAGDPMAGTFIIVNGSVSQPRSVGLGTLLSAVRASLEGAERIAAIEEILERMRPLDLSSAYDPYGSYSPFGSSPDAHYVGTVLRTWMDELPPAEALEKCQDAIERLLAWDGRTQPNRDAALNACELCAKAGDVERAARLLDMALAAHEFDPNASAAGRVVIYGASIVRTTGSLDARRRHQLFPAPRTDAWSEFSDPGAWFEAAAQTLVDLAESERADPGMLLENLGLALWRLGATERRSALDGFVERVAAHAENEPEALLWVLDAAVRSGRERAALTVERALVAARLLRTDRVPDAVWRAWQLEGTEPALELGRSLATWTLPETLLGQLAFLCTESGDADGAAKWRELADEAY